MSVVKGDTYELSLNARGADDFAGPLNLSLESDDRVVYAQARIPSLSHQWKAYRFSLTAQGTDPKARLVISTTQPGTFWLDMVSLFPRKTWKGHGLRTDLMEMLAGLKPAFVRFPGGCWVEGDTMKYAYRWKETIGDLSERRTQYNIWQYYATHGIGYHEYLQMAEDLDAEPLFVINCGMSHREVVPMDKMDEFVQDALDAIEYANGPVTSHWGALRAKNGHPAPFHLKYLEIGNENGGPAYQERYPLFYDAIRARYPEMVLVADGRTEKRPADVVDEHYYSNPEFFIQHAGRYDNYDRTGPKIYVGEYAVTQGAGQGSLRGAIGEAAFMTGMERNSDVVTMASYAPLFANVHYKKWNPDLICYDSSRVYGLPSYYVQQMFSQHRGDVVLPVDLDAPVISSGPTGGAIGVGTWMTQAEFKDIKVTRNGQALYSCDFADGTQGWKLLGGGEWNVQDGMLRQNSPKENIRAITGDKNWTDYTYSLKARKLGGAEGFLILFRVQDENAKSWWNLGGWGNRRHAVEMGGIIGNEVPGRIETGRWYDIRIVLSGGNVKCYLDGKLMHDVDYPSMKSIYASATRDNHKGEVIVKVVNVDSQPHATAIQLDGVSQVNGPAQAIVLTAANPTAENSLADPKNVVPKAETLKLNDATFQHTFPGNSVTVLRIPSKAK